MMLEHRNMKRPRAGKRDILVVAPHPDDESLGCGGTLLRHAAEGDRIHWLIVTTMGPDGYTARQRRRRAVEIRRVARLYGFRSVSQLGFPATTLDAIPRAALVKAMAAAFEKVAPHTVYVPHHGDVHTDHRVAAEAVAACVKWFRQGSVTRVLAYETLSETDFSLDPAAFAPDVFIDVSATLARKLRILEVYAGELGRFPFPRSAEAVRALAAARGAAAGCRAAEAFMLLREIR